MNNLDILRDILVSSAAITTSFVAVKGLSIWRRQLKGTTEYQISKEVLRSTFALQDAFILGRIPGMRSSELSQIGLTQERDADTKFIDARSYAYSKRLKVVEKAKSDLQLAKIETTAMWGEDSAQDLHRLLEKVYELYGAYQTYFEIEYDRQNTHGRDEAEQKIQNEARGIIFSFGGDKDAFRAEVDKIVARIEEKFRQYLK